MRASKTNLLAVAAFSAYSGTRNDQLSVLLVDMQWHSQNTADARAQHGYTTLLVALYPGPAQLSVACSMEMQKLELLRLFYCISINEFCDVIFIK